MDNWAPGAPVEEVIVRLEAGERPPDALLIRHLRNPSCDAQLLAALQNCRWVRGARRILPLILRHPKCSLAFAVDVVGRVGWPDLLAVAREPRTSPVVRRLAVRRLLERVGEMTEGERVSLARRAPRALFGLLLVDEAPRIIAALLDNPQFGETDALRLIHVNPRPECLREVLRHPRWGRLPTLLTTAIRSKEIPLAWAISIAVTLSAKERERLEAAPEVSPALKEALRQLRLARAGPAAS